MLCELQAVIDRAGPLRRQHHTRYDAGRGLEVEVTGVCPAARGRVRMVVEKFVGGGFAGQVYRVRLEAVDAPDGAIAGLDVGRRYAVKFLVPPSGISLRFRNLIYCLAYQGPFSAQVHPAAARTGVLWQKLVRRAAAIEFGRPDAVCDTYATFRDDGLGTWGEINEWVDGRQWRFELDDHYFDRCPAAGRDAEPAPAPTAAAEYVAKRDFMARLVRLLHRMGAPELARQYEWWTAKSQPNVLKRTGAGDGPADGLCAIDFRAGLALLPVLPMSPADVKLIATGLRRGALVQFDRGDLARLEAFVGDHGEQFEDLRPAIEELRQADPAYRASLIDITHHGLRPLWDAGLRRSIADGFVHGWRAKHLVDESHVARFRTSRFAPAAFLAVGLVSGLLSLAVLAAVVPVSKMLFEHWGLLPGANWPLLVLATAGAAVATVILLRLISAATRCTRRLWADRAWRLHVGAMLRRPAYLVRSLHARQAEILMDWQRSGRRSPRAILRLATCAWRFWPEKCLMGWMPVGLHRFLIEPAYAWNWVKRKVGGMILFVKDAEFRQRWLEGVIDEGHRDGILTDEEYAELRPKATDPYIRTYLLCVIGHLLSVPVTQIVAAIVAAIYVKETGDWLGGGGIMVAFQLIPVSPGSVFRGLFVIAVMIAKRNVRDFRVAVAVSFWKYVGYLGFPIQMVAKYPVLARLLAGRWARGAVRFVPVFGEHGALLEHAALDLCFNEPVSIRRRIAEGKETVARLVVKIVLGAVWFGLTVAAAILGWKARAMARSGDLTLKSLQPIVIVTGLAIVAVLTWTLLAPPFARIRRTWWALYLIAAAPVVAIILTNWTALF